MMGHHPDDIGHDGEVPVRQSYARAVKQRPRVDMLPLQEQQTFYEKEQVLRRLSVLKHENNNRLPRGERQTAARTLGVSVRTLTYWLECYEQYRQAFPKEPAMNALMKLPTGRPAGQSLTQQQQSIVLGAYLERKRTSVYGHEQLATITTRADIQYVHEVYTNVFPEQPVSTSTIRRFLAQKQKENRPLFALARNGERALQKDYLPKTTNDVSAPNDRWQSDARYLPIYIRYEEHVCRVALVSIIDDFSRYIVDWCLVPRQEIDAAGTVHHVDFTMRHVCGLFADAMRKTCVRPYNIYTDHGAQYKAFAIRLPYLTDPDEPPIAMIHSRPGRPQGRGKIERGLGQIDQVLRRLPGFVEDDNDPHAWTQARKSANLCTLEQLEEVMQKHIAARNAEQDHNGLSRAERWTQGLATSLPAPSLIRLALLAEATEWKEVTVHDTGIRYKKTLYRPAQNAEAYVRWTKAVGSKVPLCIIPNAGNAWVIVSLNGQEWEEVQPATKQHQSVRMHVQQQQTVMRRIKQEYHEVREAYRQALLTIRGEMPSIDVITGKVVFSAESARSTHKGSNPTDRDRYHVKTPEATAMNPEQDRKSPKGRKKQRGKARTSTSSNESRTNPSKAVERGENDFQEATPIVDASLGDRTTETYANSALARAKDLPDLNELIQAVEVELQQRDVRR